MFSFHEMIYLFFSVARLEIFQKIDRSPLIWFSLGFTCNMLCLITEVSGLISSQSEAQTDLLKRHFFTDKNIYKLDRFILQGNIESVI